MVRSTAADAREEPRRMNRRVQGTSAPWGMMAPCRALAVQVAWSPARGGRERLAVDDWAQIRRACALMEDEAVLVLCKPAGISVVGERHEADLLTLAASAGERLLPVHRIDKVTSGAVLLAKRRSAHADLTRQFQRRSAGKSYLAVTRSSGLPEHGTIELPFSIGRKTRVRVAAQRSSILADEASGRWSVPSDEVFTHTRTYPSLTTFVRVLEDRQRTLLAEIGRASCRERV